MSEIKRGDLVIVVAPTLCCGLSGKNGLVTTVVKILDDRPRGCVECGAIYSGNIAVCADGVGRDLIRLRRIDPPATGEYDGVPVRRKVPNGVTE